MFLCKKDVHEAIAQTDCVITVLPKLWRGGGYIKIYFLRIHHIFEKSFAYKPKLIYHLKDTDF